MKPNYLLILLFISLNTYSQQVQRITKNFQTGDGIYGIVKISTKPMTFSGGSIMIQQDDVIVQGIKYNGKNYSGSQLSAQGIQFPMECSNCYFTASGTVSMLIPGSVQRDFGRFESGGSVHKGGFLKTNQEVIFSASVKERHNANNKNGSPWEKTGRVEELRISEVQGSDFHKIRSAVKKASSSLNSNSTSSNNNSNSPSSNWNGQAHVAHVAELEWKAKNKSANKSNGLSRDEFHKQHVQQNNAAYYEREKKKKSNDNASMKEFQQQQQQKTSSIIEKQEQERREYYEKLEQRRIAQIEKQRIENERMDRAATLAAQQIQGGNYVGAGMTLAQEAANQGSVEGVAVAAGAGIVAQIFHDAAEEKERKRKEEARRLERERIARERERERQALLARQKREFNAMVDEIRRAKKAIVQSRENFLNAEISYTKTYDKFAKNGEPIYLFYTETSKNYNSYKENVIFPNTMEITIREKSELRFSPVIVVYPNSSGEYPYLKDLFSELKAEYFKKSDSNYKIYNWRKTLPEIQKLYSAISEKALKSNFIPKIPSGELLVEFNKSQSSETDNAYWTIEQAESSRTSEDEYWSTTKEQNINLKDSSRPDYWNDSIEIPKDSVNPVKSDAKPDYWSTTKKQDSIPQNNSKS
ncbi:hypothetical protein [Gramella sp. KN1008]|uniref:hypothetical protein n=1 Tax=Gramella sp. KN1008 TaxID=2529298 RepID=UPI001039CCB0|nr:hypothetical protein [Gramella sp. KN1008]TBW25886.1 hypothetical protein EZJ28_14735 [Gramella sp. KN1008]